MQVREISDDTLKKMTKDELIAHIVMIQTSSCMKNCKPIHPDISYRDLVEGSLDVLFVIDLNGNLVYHNNAWSHVFGNIGLEQGEHYSSYIKGIDLERAKSVFDFVTIDGKIIENEIIKIFDTNGKKQYFSASFSPVLNLDENITGLIGSFKNVTMLYLIEKKLKEKSHILEEKVLGQIKHQEELQVLHDFNSEIIRNAPIGIFMIDPSGIMLTENPKLKEIMGHGSQTRIGVNILNYEGFKQSGFVELFEECLSNKKTVIKVNTSYVPISRDRELIITLSMMPIMDKTGAVEKIVAMVEDNTEEFMIAQKATKTQRNAVLGVFSSEIASDIRNNVNRMFMDLNFVSNNIPENSPVTDYIKDLKTNAERLRIVSDDLLSLSITEESEKMPCDLISIFENPPIQPILENLIHHHIKLDTQFFEERPQVFATLTQLQNVFKQLILNARDSMPDGGSLTISVKILKDDSLKYVVVEIQDTGFGISEENIKNIFKAFYTTKGDKATGLGLMVVCFILDNIQGILGIKSIPGEGTNIRVALPMLIN